MRKPHPRRMTEKLQCVWLGSCGLGNWFGLGLSPFGGRVMYEVLLAASAYNTLWYPSRRGRWAAPLLLRCFARAAHGSGRVRLIRGVNEVQVD